jgi:hypothetical protein
MGDLRLLLLLLTAAKSVAAHSRISIALRVNKVQMWGLYIEAVSS